MKITFIQPYYENVWESLGIGYIKAYADKCLKEVGCDVDFDFFHGNFDRDADMVECGSNSDIVAFSCTSPTFGHVVRLATQIKNLNPSVHIVVGGWHPTAVPDDVIKEPCIDQVIVGEGELAMVRCILGSRQPILKGVKLESDELPWPDRRFIQNQRTVFLAQQMTGKRIASFQMNRGCKVHCKFCSEITMTGKHHSKNNPIRTRNFDDLLSEINDVAYEFCINYFKFVDATFDKDAQSVIDFCEAKIKAGMVIPWEANIHAGFAQSKEVFEWLAKANCVQINVGIESGSPYVLKDIGKGTSVSQIKKVFKWAKECGIKRRAYILFGMPEEDASDHEDTMGLINEIEPDVVGFTILAPYPGSDYYSPVLYKNVDWSKVDEYSNDIWQTANFSNSQLKYVQKWFKERYEHLLCERQA